MNTHILIVDSDEQLTASMERVLNQSSCQTTVCHETEQALDYYTKNWRKIDLLLLDFSMPSVNGYDMMVDFIFLNPDARIILMTEPAMEEFMTGYMGASRGMLKKPFRSEELLGCVKKALG